MVKTDLFKDRMEGMMEKAKKTDLIAVPTVTAMSLPMTALAADTSTSPTGDLFDTIAASMVASIQDMVSAVGSAVGSIIPVAFPLIAVGMGITICIAVFRRITNQA